MILSTTVHTFRSALSLITPLTTNPKQSTHAQNRSILSCFKLRITAAGTVILGTTNNEASLVVQLANATAQGAPNSGVTNLPMDLPISLAIPAADLSTILGGLPSEAGITLESDSTGHHLTIRSGRSMWTRNLEDVTLYPDFYGLKLPTMIQADSEALRAALLATLPIAKPLPIPGISFEHASADGIEGMATLVAYDGKKFVARSFPISYLNSDPHPSPVAGVVAPFPIIPASQVKLLTSILSLGGQCHLSYNANSLRVAVGPAIFSCQLLPAKFVEWAKFTRPTTPQPARLSASAFVAALRNGSLNGEETHRVRLELSPGSEDTPGSTSVLGVSSEDSTGKSSTVVEIAYAGPVTSVSFQAPSLIEVLAPLGDAEVTMHVKDGKSAVWLVAEGWEAVVMPLVS